MLIDRLRPPDSTSYARETEPKQGATSFIVFPCYSMAKRIASAGVGGGIGWQAFS